jgi:hypothetical protein
VAEVVEVLFKYLDLVRAPGGINTQVRLGLCWVVFGFVGCWDVWGAGWRVLLGPVGSWNMLAPFAFTAAAAAPSTAAAAPSSAASAADLSRAGWAAGAALQLA